MGGCAWGGVPGLSQVCAAPSSLCQAMCGACGMSPCGSEGDSESAFQCDSFSCPWHALWVKGRILVSFSFF